MIVTDTGMRGGVAAHGVWCLSEATILPVSVMVTLRASCRTEAGSGLDWFFFGGYLRGRNWIVVEPAIVAC
jgi:hypothetical protein